MPSRINVVGASGSGATTLGRYVARALALPYHDSDDFYHGPSEPPFNNPRTPEERHALITSELDRTSSWVLGGGVAGWEPYPELDFTLVVLVWIPLDVRIARLRERERQRFGARVLPGGDMYEQHEDFVAWASRYDAGDVEGKTLARHTAYLEEQTCPVLFCRGVHEVEELFARVRHALASAHAP